MARNPANLLTLVLIAMVAVAALPGIAHAQSVDDLRITEVSPSTDEVEVTYFGSSTLVVPNVVWFCHNTIYTSFIPTGEVFAPGQSRVYTMVSGLSNTLSEVWLFRANDFDNAANQIHGLHYGGTVVGVRTQQAVTVGKWPNINTTLAVPAAGHSLTNPTGSFNPADWYIDANPALGTNPNPDPAPGTVSGSLAWPSSVETFESLDFGNPVNTLQSWIFIDGGATFDFTARAAGDTPSTNGERPTNTSTWIRVHDADSGDNRFYSSDILATGIPETYRWTWFVLFETLPPAGALGTHPRMVVQHHNGAGYDIAWGIEYTDSDAYLIVTPFGGGGSPVPIGSINSNVWYRFDLHVSFLTDTIQASMNYDTTVSAPINLNLTGNRARFRYCYRGEGSSSPVRLLLDDLGFLGSAANTPATLTATRNGAPVANNATITVREGTTMASLGLAFTADDADGDPVKVSTTISNQGAITGLSIGQFQQAMPRIPAFTLTPTNGSFTTPNVTHTFEFTVDDGQGATTLFTFHVDVLPNTLPAITATQNGAPLTDNTTITVTEGDALADLMLEFTADDADGDPIVVSAMISDQGAATGLVLDEFQQLSPQAPPFTLTPTSGSFTTPNITHTFALTVNDGRGTPTTFTFHVEVQEADNGGGGGGNDDDPAEEGGCGTANGTGVPAQAMLLLALFTLAAVRRRI